MTRYIKSQPGYDQVTFDADGIRKEYTKRPRRRKRPTSVALDPETVSQLRAVAESKGVPYQVLVRMFIVEGLKRSRPQNRNS
jgi:hypothetical protein